MLIDSDRVSTKKHIFFVDIKLKTKSENSKMYDSFKILVAFDSMSGFFQEMPLIYKHRYAVNY